MRTIGVIGTGSMGSVIAGVLAKSNCELLLSNRSQDKAQILARELGASVCGSDELASGAEYIFLCVKPQMMPQLLESIKDVLARRKDSFVLVSIAAGLSVERLQHMLGAGWSLIRMVPNTPAAIGEGMAVYTCSGEVSTEQEKDFLAMMAASGRLLRIEESLIDIASTVSGCGPAFVNMFIEAMADGGVACGLPREQAMELAAQMRELPLVIPARAG